jgi:phosphatidylglycerophosphatase A
MSLPLSSLRNPAILLSTWFGAGLLPKAPGTWGSLAALPFAWIIVSLGGSSALAMACLVVYGVGVWAADQTIKITGIKDPGLVVIDEVVGQWIVLIFTPLHPLLYLVGFGLFRLFDILKPWPVSWADQKIEGGTGVMLDDVLAGLYGLALIQLLQLILAGQL